MSDINFETLVYRITGNVVSDDMTVRSEIGTTYNFVESMPHHPIQIEVAKNAKKISYQDAIVKIFELVQENKALSSIVVEDIVDVMSIIFDIAPNYVINFDAIKNREVKIRLLSELNQPIKSDIVYNVLFFKITGRTQYVRTFREFRRAIIDTSVINDDIANFIMRNRDSLAQYYRRNRSLLLYIKNNFFARNSKLRRVINNISKTSRHVNKPASNKKFSDVPFDKKPTSELLKMLYATNTIMIRNGLQYTVQNRSEEPYSRDEILKVLRTRDDIFTDEQKALVNDGWELALPSSAKRAAGIVPNGSSIKLEAGQKIGVRWYDSVSESSYVDLDLSFTTLSTKYGWNGRKYGDVTYSGDMTSMQPVDKHTQSAMETFTINNPDIMGVIDLSSFNFGGATTKIELIIGDILLPIEKPTSTTVLGYTFGNRFYVYVDNRINAQDAVNSVNSATISSHETFNSFNLTKSYTL